LTALRNDLIHDILIDSGEAAELLQLFLMGRGFGASPEAARDAVGRVERVAAVADLRRVSSFATPRHRSRGNQRLAAVHAHKRGYSLTKLNISTLARTIDS
jgi:hypothetical protein